MKHKKFAEIFPYTYYFKNIETGQKYHGVRWANVRLGVSPLNDFGKKYFSSGKLQKDFKNNMVNYTFKISWTFDTIEEAQAYESGVNSKLMYKDDWEIWNNSKAIYNKISPSLGRKVKGTLIADKISAANKGKKRSNDVKQKMSEHQKFLVENRCHYFCSDKHAETTSKRMIDNNPSSSGLSEDHKKKIGDSHRGVPKPAFTSEHKKNISESLKGNVPWNFGIKGKQKHSAETKKKMSDSAHGTKHLAGKKVCCLCCKREWDLGNYTKHIKKVINI